MYFMWLIQHTTIFGVFEVSTCIFLQDDDEVSVKSYHSAKSATSSSSESTTVKSHRSVASSTASSSTARSQPPPTQVRKIVKVFYSPDMVNYQFQNSIFFLPVHRFYPYVC